MFLTLSARYYTARGGRAGRDADERGKSAKR